MGNRHILIDVTEVGLIKTEAFIQQLSWAKLPFTDIETESGVVVRTVEELKDLSNFLENRREEAESEKERLIDEAWDEEDRAIRLALNLESDSFASIEKDLTEFCNLMEPNDE